MCFYFQIGNFEKAVLCAAVKELKLYLSTVRKQISSSRSSLFFLGRKLEFIIRTLMSGSTGFVD